MSRYRSGIFFCSSGSCFFLSGFGSWFFCISRLRLQGAKNSGSPALLMWVIICREGPGVIIYYTITYIPSKPTWCKNSVIGKCWLCPSLCWSSVLRWPWLCHPSIYCSKAHLGEMWRQKVRFCLARIYELNKCPNRPRFFCLWSVNSDRPCISIRRL